MYAPSRTLHRRGFTLITALAFTLVVGTVLAGVGTVAVSHYGRAEVEGDYANAIALAEAGINYELMWISRDTTDPNRPHQEGSEYTGSVPGVPGTFKVYVRSYGTNCDGGNWTVLNDVCIISTGEVNGIKRTARVRGARKSIFDDYPLYVVSTSNNAGTISGLGTSKTSTRIVGNMGSNGGTKFNGSVGSEGVEGELSLNGPDAGVDEMGPNVLQNPDPVNFPTVAEMAAQLFPGGLEYLKTNNNNANIRQLKSSDTGLAGISNLQAFTLDHVTSKLASAGFSASSRTFGDPGNSVPSATSNLDDLNGPRFFQAEDATYDIDPYGIQTKKVYFVPPGDYYFTRVDLKNGNAAVVFLTHLGRVRLWIDEGSNQADSMKVVFITTGGDGKPQNFRIYYNKCNTLTVTGNSKFYGSFYAVKDGCSSQTPMMNFTGNSMVYGSVISSFADVSGGTKIVFPNNGGGSDPDDWPLWLGFGDGWKEINLIGNPVFVDGTSN